MGHGSVVLVAGEAGIGKTSLVRAFAEEAAESARLLLSACDDLMAPRTLGPLRDAAAGSDGPLAAALADEEPVDGVFTALLEELAAEPPTVLVVEDIHWADDATLDVLGYAARRIEPLRRGARADVPRRRDRRPASAPAVPGRCSSARPVQRLALAPLSFAAVRRLCAGTGRGRRDPPPRHARQPVLRDGGAGVAA